MNFKKLLKSGSLLLILILTSSELFSQFSYKSVGYWRQNRVELIGQIGALAFRGDIGRGVGADRTGLGNLDIKNPARPTLTLGARYYVAKNFSVRGNFTFGQLYSADRDGNSDDRINRNLRFRTNFVDINAMFEVHLLKERTSFRSAVRGSRGKAGFSVGVYGFAGIGVMLFNPRAQVYDAVNKEFSGDWIALQPLGTEGQLLPGGDGKYSRVAATFPIGFGVRKSITRNLSIGVELAYVFTSSDYLDDASTVYADRNALANQNPLTARLADPSIGANWTAAEIEAAGLNYSPSWTGTGQARGNEGANDNYMYTMINVSYKLVSNARAYGKKPKRISKNKKIIF